MSSAQVHPPQNTLTIPCIINRASLGYADYVFVILHELASRSPKVAWVPRTDILVEEQPLSGDQLRARLRVRIEREVADTYEVVLLNEGQEETITVSKATAQ